MKNNCLNFIKGISCFGIVYMHTSYDCLLSSIITCAFRLAVPVFFMISGYFIYYSDDEKVLYNAKKRCKHITKLFVYAYVVNQICMFIIVPLIQHKKITILNNIRNLFLINSLKNIIIFNQMGGILWFLLALIYCYILIILINKFSIYKQAYCVAFLLVITHIFIRGFIQYNALVAEEINVV